MSSAVKCFRLITSHFLFLILNNNIIMCGYSRAHTDDIDILQARLPTCQTMKSKSTFCRNPLIALVDERHSDCAFVHFTALTCRGGETKYFLNSIATLNNSLLFDLLCKVTPEVYSHTYIKRKIYFKNFYVFHPKARQNNAIGTRWYFCKSDELFRIHSDGNT